MLTVQAPCQGLHDVTDRCSTWIRASSMTQGLVTIFCRHTSASLLIQENAAPEARADIEDYFARVAPESSSYRHNDEGRDDMPAHLRAAMTCTQLTIPVLDGRMMLGTWQGIYLFEHRREPPPRQIVLHLLGE